MRHLHMNHEHRAPQKGHLSDVCASYIMVIVDALHFCGIKVPQEALVRALEALTWETELYGSFTTLAQKFSDK